MTPPDIYLREHNRATAEHIAQCRIEDFIRKELSDGPQIKLRFG